jgi:hypothetical protein
MTDTAAPASTVEAEDSTPAALLGTLEHLNPTDLVLDTNVRDEAAVDADFVASVKEHGVLTPIAALRDDDGTVRVRLGSLSSSVLLSIRVARRSAAVAVIGQGEVTRWIQRYREGSVWVVMAARMRRLLGGSFSIVLGRCLRLFSTMRSHGRIGVCWSGRRDGCAMVSRFSSGRVGWSMSGVRRHSG